MKRAALVSSLFLVTIAAFVACSSDADSGAGTTDPDGGPGQPTGEGGSSSGNPDSGPGPKDDAGGSDGGSDAEPPLTKQTEKEPNNLTSKTDVNPMTVPGEMTGVIDTSDTDGFSVVVAPGELWEWTVTPTGAALAPHLVVFDLAPNNKNPTRLVQAAAGQPVTLAHFVLAAGDFVAGLRDARNVEKPPQNVGGPTFGYTLTARKKTPAPTAVTFPATKSGKLASLGALDFYAFNGTMGAGFDIVIKAARKTQPSTLDSRISLFDVTNKTVVITNDDAAKSTDSEIGGNFPATSSYLLVVESEGTNATDLSYDVAFTLR